MILTCSKILKFELEIYKGDRIYSDAQVVHKSGG